MLTTVVTHGSRTSHQDLLGKTETDNTGDLFISGDDFSSFFGSVATESLEEGRGLLKVLSSRTTHIPSLT